MRNRYYVVNEGAPGNPWGPFVTKATAEVVKAELETYFKSKFYLRHESSGT